MPRQDRISLQTASFNPTPFQAVTFTPQAADASILAHSLDTIAQREKETSEKLGAMDVTFSELRNKLHQDPETLKWFEDYTNAQKTKVKNYVNNYDFAGAINKATELAAETVNNPELSARINANTTRTNLENTVKKMFQEGKIGKDTYTWWFKNNQFHYENIYDPATGNVIGGTDYSSETYVPYADLSEEEVVKRAKDLLEVHKSVTGRENEWTSGTTGGDYGETTTVRKGGYKSQYSHEWNTAQELWNNMDYIIDGIQDGRGRMEQQFDVLRDKYIEMKNELNRLRTENIDGRYDTAIQNLQQKIEGRKYLMEGGNGGITDYKTYYFKVILQSRLGKQAVRDWTTSVTGSSSYNVSDINPEDHRGTSNGAGNSDDTYYRTDENGIVLNGPHARENSAYDDAMETYKRNVSSYIRNAPK